MAADLPKIHFERFDSSRHDVSTFGCGKSPQVDNYIRLLARTMQLHTLHRTHVAIRVEAMPQSDGRIPIEGFFTLSAGEISPAFGVLSDVQAKRITELTERVPVVWLEWIGIRKEWVGSGLGTILLIEALRTIESVSYDIGVTGCALRPVPKLKVIARYAAMGFTPIDFNEKSIATLMFMPITLIEALVGRTETRDR